MRLHRDLVFFHEQNPERTSTIFLVVIPDSCHRNVCMAILVEVPQNCDSTAKPILVIQRPSKAAVCVGHLMPS